MLESANLPSWLKSLLDEKNFFNSCTIHETARKNEKNIFCLDCCDSICAHCLPHHNNHRLLQVRRYVYHDVIRVVDAEKLMDCAFVQSYINNSAKVVFLNERPQTRPCRGTGKLCITCYRSLQEPYLFCSLSCKLQHLVSSGEDLSKHILDCKILTLPEPGDEGIMTPDTVLEQVGSVKIDSCSSGGGIDENHNLACPVTVEVVRKKRSGCRTPCRPIYIPAVVDAAALMNRRKNNTPQRSPLY